MTRSATSSPSTTTTLPPQEAPSRAKPLPTVWADLDRQHQGQLSCHLAELIRRLRSSPGLLAQGGADDEH